jgi:hypothetical protein
MFSRPAVVVHGLEDACAALRPGLPVLLVSAPGAALYAGAGWWRALIEAATRAYPATPCNDLLDCADAPGRAMAALRAGCSALVLDPACPAFTAVQAAAGPLGAVVLGVRPVTMDVAQWHTIARNVPPA